MRIIFTSSLLLLLASAVLADQPAVLRVVGDWRVEVSVAEPRPLTVTLEVTPPPIVAVEAERYGTLPLFNAAAAGWTKGARLKGVVAQETTTPNLLEPGSTRPQTRLIAMSSMPSASIHFRGATSSQIIGHIWRNSTRGVGVSVESARTRRGVPELMRSIFRKAMVSAA